MYPDLVLFFLTRATPLTTVGIGAPADPETQLTVERTGAAATNTNALVVSNTANNFGTDGTRKTGVKVRSIGGFPGSFGTVTINTGLEVQVDGADVNQAATFMGGNVGIGTTTPDPSAALEVVGDVRINSMLDLGTDPCSAPSQSGRGHLCFNGAEFVVSENGGPYQDVLTTGDTVSGSTTPAILKAVQNAPGSHQSQPYEPPAFCPSWRSHLRQLTV
ncbi:MAG TPA: hypothetical protein VNN18_01305 [Candidatus Xenobia bacterium]|nr:hypothetical protein [Candidatus Xenobia bacterium]